MATTTAPKSPSQETLSAFFYGTLMAPQVLHRVIHGSMSPTNPIYTTHNLKTSPAILHNHRRHRVKSADYPALLPHPTSSVRGTYVTNLNPSDIWRLDIFEGSEYTRQKVTVRILTTVGGEDGEGNVEGEEVEAETYIWSAAEEELEDKEWDFGEFQREKMRFWVGREGEGEYAGRESIIEVDEAVAAADKDGKADGTRGRGANGHISNALKEKQQKSLDAAV